jgi:hypothetical protein
MDVARMIVDVVNQMEQTGIRRIFMYVFKMDNDVVSEIWERSYIWITKQKSKLMYATTREETFTKDMLLSMPVPEKNNMHEHHIKNIGREALRRFSGSADHLAPYEYTIVVGMEAVKQDTPLFPELPCHITELFYSMNDNDSKDKLKSFWDIVGELRKERLGN